MEMDDVQPYIIMKWLVLNDRIAEYVRWLDKYTFVLPAKMFLSLAWSVIPKQNKAPFIRWIKENKEEEEFEFILKKIRKHLDLSDNDYQSNKTRLIKSIKNDYVNWFKFYGIEAKYYRQYNVEVKKQREGGLAQWSTAT
jgi:hypothetical protein